MPRRSTYPRSRTSALCPPLTFAFPCHSESATSVSLIRRFKAFVTVQVPLTLLFPSLKMAIKMTSGQKGVALQGTKATEPHLERSLSLSFIGDWGGANFHRILSHLTQEFCDRAGPETRIGIFNIRHGGTEALSSIHDGSADLCLATPAGIIAKSALTGSMSELFPSPMPDLRALAILPQNDRMVLAIDPKFGINSFAELRAKKPALRIATSAHDGTSFIGYVASRYMAAHGIDEATLRSWGGEYVTGPRPEQSLFLARDGEVDAVLQEAIMTGWWIDVVEGRGWVPLPAEGQVLEILEGELGLGSNELPKGYWTSLEHPLPALDFSDFLVLVRADMPEDVAHLLAWCLVETREGLEAQYCHLSQRRSPLSYPLAPEKMARTGVPLHEGARTFYEEKGYLNPASQRKG